MTPKTKVLCIVGAGRSGSTILGQVLDGVEGFFSVGELYYLWDRGLLENRLCGCGVFFKECPLWTAVLKRSFGGAEGVDAEEMLRLREHTLSNRQLLFAPAKTRREALARMGNYLRVLEILYDGVRSASQSKVIVDTSKSPSYCYELDSIPSIEVYVVHLVRDPRATAYSWWTRRKLQPASEKRPSRYMTRHHPLKTSLIWDAWNFLIEKLWAGDPNRYLLLRYEDFVEDPQGALRDILRLVGEEDAKLPFTGEREVSLSANHVFSGNPSRLQSGTVKIKPDEEWRQKMGRVQKALIALTTWPHLLRYGYGLGLGPSRPNPAEAGASSGTVS